MRNGDLNSWSLGQDTVFSESVVASLSTRAQRLLLGSPRQREATPYVGYNSGDETIFE
eukprot:SAG31_NODE_42123_length_273_cov_0.586207_1_plen_57_part_10